MVFNSNDSINLTIFGWSIVFIIEISFFIWYRSWFSLIYLLGIIFDENNSPVSSFWTKQTDDVLPQPIKLITLYPWNDSGILIQYPLLVWVSIILLFLSNK